MWAENRYGHWVLILKKLHQKLSGSKVVCVSLLTFPAHDAQADRLCIKLSMSWKSEPEELEIKSIISPHIILMVHTPFKVTKGCHKKIT